MGRRRLPVAVGQPGAALEVPLRQARRRRLGARLVGRGLRLHRPRPHRDCRDLQRRRGPAPPCRQGRLPRGDARALGGGRGPNHEVRVVAADPRRRRQVQPLPLLQLPRPPRRQGARRRPRGGPRGVGVVRVHLARGPGTRDPVRDRVADQRGRLQRPAQLQADRDGRQEPRREQAVRVALHARDRGAGRQARHDRARVQPPSDQVGLLDPRAGWPVRHRADARHRQGDHRPSGLRRRLPPELHRHAAARAPRHARARPRATCSPAT